MNEQKEQIEPQETLESEPSRMKRFVHFVLRPKIAIRLIVVMLSIAAPFVYRSLWWGCVTCYQAAPSSHNLAGGTLFQYCGHIQTANCNTDVRHRVHDLQNSLSLWERVGVRDFNSPQRHDDHEEFRRKGG